MNTFVLDRINIQNQKAKVTIVPASPPPQILSEPIAPEDFKSLLLNEFNKTVEVIEALPDEKRFDTIYDFAAWYPENVKSFNEEQNKALMTLMDTRQMIENGCGCKRKGRERAAFDYYKEFWDKNKTNDLLPALLKASGAKKISIGALNFP